jgi:predicted RNase H-like HicB family nuclease/predicted RNA binding protein YcfA (HicA-like mRNA interferase family)
MRNLGCTEFRRLVEAFGFKLRRVSGGHHIYRHPEVPRPLSLQPHQREAKPYQISQFLDIGRGTRPENGTPPMTAKYNINLFWSEPDGAWVADVPDLQSCSAFGESPAQALTEVERAMEAWLAVAREEGCRSQNPGITWQDAASG